MGREVQCEGKLGRTTGLFKAHLDSAAIDLRGAARARIEFSAMRAVRCEGDSLVADTDAGALRLMMGAREAALWAKKIQNPPSLADKLGLNAGVTYATIGRRHAEIATVLSECAGVKSAPAHAKLVFVCVIERADLAQFEKADATLSEGAALWVVRAKGKDVAISEADIMAAAKRAGWVPTKTARWSETRTADRYTRRAAH